MNSIITEHGTKYWFKDGKLHRLDGPAVEWNNGIKDWYYEDRYITSKSQKEFERLINLKAFWR